MRLYDIDQDLYEELGFDERPENPPRPAEGRRKTFLLTFDNGGGDTAGMLDVIRAAGHFAVAYSTFPRTTIICRVAEGTADSIVLDLVSRNLLDDGSAMVVVLGTTDAYVWPKRRWRRNELKRWAKVKP